MKLSTIQRRIILTSLYTATAGLILLAIWNPSFKLEQGSIDLLLLMDESDSIRQQDNNEIWQSFLNQSQLTGKHGRISLIRFADRNRVEIPWLSTATAEFDKLLHKTQPPRHEFIDQGATAIAPALEKAIQLSFSDNPIAIVLSTDGIENMPVDQQKSPVNKFNQNISLFYLNSEGKQNTPGFMIESINVPEQAGLQSDLPVSLAVKAISGGSASLEILNNNSLVYKQDILMDPDQLLLKHLRLPGIQSSSVNLKFLIRDNKGKVLDQRHRIINTQNEKRLLYVSNESTSFPHQLVSLYGWKTTSITAPNIPADNDYFDNFNVVMLNDIRADAINSHSLRNLRRSIHQFGTGLIVLGGPNSFGSGAYRNSELEKLLPVIAESSRPVSSAAFLFLVDKSGSMETKHRGISQLSNAMQAVIESAKSLRINDESALLTFDRNTDELLPLQQRQDTLTEIRQYREIQPSGGTQLEPALAEAIHLLSKSASKKRFIILVTDGFVDNVNINNLKQALLKSEIQLIALALGNDANLSTLSELTGINGGKLLSLKDSTQLPFFMRQLLETQMHSWQIAEETPQTVTPLPFINETNSWERIKGYQITRAKPGAIVYVTTDKANPLLAVSYYGAGKIAALPAGMLKTLTAINLSAGLVNWVDSQQTNPRMEVRHSYQSGKITILMDVVDRNNIWKTAPLAKIILTYPDGSSRTKLMETIAPGQYSAVMQAGITGIYTARLSLDNEHTIYTAYISHDQELRYNTKAPWLQHALSTGQIQPWTEHTVANLINNTSGSMSIRPLCLLLAIISYLFLIMFEKNAITVIQELAGKKIQKLLKT